MIVRELRLGDAVDDYCSRCRSLSDHVVLTLAEGKIKKVRCKTCHVEHDYKHGKGGRPKKTEVQSLVQKMLNEMPEPRKPPPPKAPKPSLSTSKFPGKK